MTEQKPLSHIGDDGKARMVDVSKKAETHRIATAKGRIYMQPETLNLIQDGGMAKGDVFSVARIAGIMAAKQTGTLIPLCHPLPLQNIQIDFTLNHDENYIEITASASLVGRTGRGGSRSAPTRPAASRLRARGASIARRSRTRASPSRGRCSHGRGAPCTSGATWRVRLLTLFRVSPSR